jgi:hypothetical protein
MWSSTDIIPLLFLRVNPTKVKGKVLQLSALLIAQVYIYKVQISGYQSFKSYFYKIKFSRKFGY